MINYFNKIKDFLIWIATMAIIVFTLCGLHQCDLNASKVPQNGNKVDTVLMVRHDTINKIQTELKIKTIYIDTGRIEYIHDTLDRLVRPVGDENVMIAENQLRECMKWKDSLNTCLDMRKVDSGAIDSLVKIGKEKAPESGGLIHDLKVFGSGVLVGAGVRSFF